MAKRPPTYSVPLFNCADIVSLTTFFSVDKDGNLATNGSDITIKSNGGTFTATTILLIAEQMVPQG